MGPRGLLTTAAVGAALALAVAAVAMPQAASERSRVKPFTVSGTVTGLYPGADRPLRLVLRNPHPFAIRVTALWAEVGDASRRCRGYNLSVSGLGSAVTIAPRGDRRVVLRATLLGWAPAACRGASFRLSYGGRAVRP
jgi:hypothetical protein